jgi:hypothetical protein
MKLSDVFGNYVGVNVERWTLIMPNTGDEFFKVLALLDASISHSSLHPDRLHGSHDCVLLSRDGLLAQIDAHRNGTPMLLI